MNSAAAFPSLVTTRAYFTDISMLSSLKLNFKVFLERVKLTGSAEAVTRKVKGLSLIKYVIGMLKFLGLGEQNTISKPAS